MKATRSSLRVHVIDRRGCASRRSCTAVTRRGSRGCSILTCHAISTLGGAARRVARARRGGLAAADRRDARHGRGRGGRRRRGPAAAALLRRLRAHHGRVPLRPQHDARHLLAGHEYNWGRAVAVVSLRSRSPRRPSRTAEKEASVSEAWARGRCLCGVAASPPAAVAVAVAASADGGERGVRPRARDRCRCGVAAPPCARASAEARSRRSRGGVAETSRRRRGDVAVAASADRGAAPDRSIDRPLAEDARGDRCGRGSPFRSLALSCQRSARLRGASGARVRRAA